MRVGGWVIRFVPLCSRDTAPPPLPRDLFHILRHSLEFVVVPPTRTKWAELLSFSQSYTPVYECRRANSSLRVIFHP